jgi:hypothetical protein
MTLHDVRSADLRARIKFFADKAFTNHVLLKEGDGRWYCGKPGTCIYSFRVIVAPRAVIVYGDIGEVILLPNDNDALAWLRGSVSGNAGDVDYALGKSPWDLRTRQFLPAEVEAYIAECEANEDEQALGKKLRQGWELADQESPEAWAETCHEAGMDEWPNCDDWGNSMLWCYCGLQKFLQLLAAEASRLQKCRATL